MAPVVAGVGPHYSGAASGSTVSATKPSGVADGDLLLAVHYVEHNGSGTLLAPPSGWVNAPDAPAFQAVANGCALYLWYKIVSSAVGEPSSYSLPAQSSRWAAGGIMRVTGADPTNPWDGGDGAVLADATSTPNVSITTTGPERLAIWAAGSYEPSAWSSLPAGFTEYAGWASADLTESTVATRTLTEPATVGSSVATGVIRGKAAWVGAIRSPAAGPEPGRMLISQL